MNNSTSVRRPCRQKPVRPVEVNKLSDNKEVLDIFNELIGEARKEFRKCPQLSLKGMIRKTECDSITFLTDRFNLTIQFNA